jgi:hypothetical protein
MPCHGRTFGPPDHLPTPSATIPPAFIRPRGCTIIFLCLHRRAFPIRAIRAIRG